jgi:hypothetical protein
MAGPSERSSLHDDTTTDASFVTPLATPMRDVTAPRVSSDCDRKSHFREDSTQTTPRAERSELGEDSTTVLRGKEPHSDDHASSLIARTPLSEGTEGTPAATVEQETGDVTGTRSIETQSVLETKEDDAKIIPPGIVPVDLVGVVGTKGMVEGGSEEVEEKEQENGEDEDESKYPRGLPLFILTAGLFLATFVVALDNTIIATAIPKITQDFDSLGDVGWYG